MNASNPEWAAGVALKPREGDGARSTTTVDTRDSVIVNLHRETRELKAMLHGTTL